MDSEHRHELKTNELADWIGHAPDFIRKNYMQILGGILVIIGIFWWMGELKRKENKFIKKAAPTTELIEQLPQSKVAIAQAEDSAASDTLIGLAGSLETAAGKAATNSAAALVMIKRAEALRTELHYKAEELDAAAVSSQIEIARGIYEQALKKAEGNPSLEAMATYGLGLCAEEVGDYDKASEIYNSIVSNEDFAGTVFTVKAQVRLNTMVDNQMKFVFADSPEPVIEIAPEAAPEAIQAPAAQKTESETKE